MQNHGTIGYLSRSAGKPESRSRADRGSNLMFTCLPCRKLAEQSITFLTRYRSGGTPLHHQDACTGSCGPLSEEPGPTSSPGSLPALVLLVAARRWVLAGNTFWHARWDNQQRFHRHLKLRWV